MPAPNDQDVMVVQDRLAQLYATLTPAQQQVLDTIMAAGLSFVDEDDTGGYMMVNSQVEMEQYMRDRMSTLQEDWRRANYSAEEPQDGEDRRMRWNLKPLLDWFNRPAQPSPA